MTTKNCTKSPNLVWKDMCKKSLVWNVQLPGKIFIQKRGRTAIPLWNIFVSVSTHIKKSIVENVGNSTGIVNRFATFLKGGNIVSFNFTDVYDWSNSCPDFFNIIPVTQKVILK